MNNKVRFSAVLDRLASINMPVLVVLCLLCALLAFVPALVFGVRESNDIHIHLSWFFSFKDALASGVLYPRWLPDQYGGMGSSALYFYPPFTSYFFTLVDVLSAHAFTADHVFSVAAFILSLLSGVSFHIWARCLASRKMALLTATLYALAPYHLLLNYYSRGAIAEFAAYVWIPLVFAGIFRILKEGTATGCLMLATGVCGLFFTHLLSVMLVGPLAIAYLLVTLQQLLQQYASAGATDRRQLWQRVAMLVFVTLMGAGIAAIYFIPAITLIPFANSDAWHWQPAADTGIWKAIFHLDRKPDLKIFVIACAYLLLAAYLLLELLLRRRNKASGSVVNQGASFWLLAVCVIFALMCGALKFLFTAPSPFAQIQFLSRMMILAEFSLPTALALIFSGWPPARHSRADKYPLRMEYLCLAFLLLLVVFEANDVRRRFVLDKTLPSMLVHEMVIARQSPNEYLPHGIQKTSDGIRTLQIVRGYSLQAQPGRIESGEGHINHIDRQGAAFDVDVTVKTPARLLLYAFYFPGWTAVTRVEGQNIPLAVMPLTEDRLVSLELPPGRHQIHVSRISLAEERLGTLVSAMSLVLLIIFFVAVRYSRSAKS